MKQGLLILACALASTRASAGEPEAVGPGTPAVVAEYAQQTRGPTLFVTYVTDTFGKAIPVLIDFQWAAVRSFQEHRVLLTFDAAGGFTTGYGGNSNPKFFLFGGNFSGRGEVGRRFAPERDASLYLGATLVLRGSAVAVTTAAPSQYDQINSVDGLAGFNGLVALRVNPGVSLLHGRVSLLVTAFAEESLRDPGSALSGPLFTSFGGRAQLDVEHSLTVTLEGAWGTTFGRVDAVGTTNTGTRFEWTASVRKMLGPIWLALEGQLHGTTNTALTADKTTWVTATPTFVSAGLTFGVSL